MDTPELRMVKGILERLPRPAIVMNQSGRALVRNAAADRLLAEKAGIELQGEVLWLQATSRVLDMPYLRSQPRRSYASGSHQPADTILRVCLPATSGAATLFAEVHPMGAGGTARETGDAAFVIHLQAISESQHISVRALQDILGLTAAEARVAGMLYEGRKMAEIAVDLKISPHTAKKHLISVFRKCDVRTQSQLMRLLAMGPFLSPG